MPEETAEQTAEGRRGTRCEKKVDHAMDHPVLHRNLSPFPRHLGTCKLPGKLPGHHRPLKRGYGPLRGGGEQRPGGCGSDHPDRSGKQGQVRRGTGCPAGLRRGFRGGQPVCLQH